LLNTCIYTQTYKDILVHADDKYREKNICKVKAILSRTNHFAGNK